MLFAVKGNKELRITEDERDLFEKRGYSIIEVYKNVANDITNDDVVVEPTEDELRTQAKELGLNLPHNTGVEKLKERIAKALSEEGQDNE